MISVLISSESRYRVDRDNLRRKVIDFLTKRSLFDIEVSILVVGTRKMRDLSKVYRKIDEMTDVLSFPLEEARGPDQILRLGDIVVCYPVARSEAAKENKLVDEKITELVEHALAHLLGEHHE